MQVRFWGTRGSFAKPGASTVRYGGNTSCVQVVSSAGTLLIIDCGTGAHELGQMLMRQEKQPIKGHILISHTHWDHIQGIPFFAPLFIPGNSWDFYAPQGFGESLRDTLGGQMEYTYFPVTPDAFGAEVRYNNLTEGSFRIDDIVIHTRYLNHPALTLAYRIEVDGVAIVYSCDHEPHSRQLAMGEGPIEGEDRLHAEFFRGADLVIHDAQYTPAEYATKIGWGHSTAEYAVKMCQSVGVKRVALTHHDPMRTDDAIDELMTALHKRIGPDDVTHVFAAAEGMILDLDAPEAVPVAPEPEEPTLESTLAAFGVTDGEPPLLLLVTADGALSDKIMQAIAQEPVKIVRAQNRETALRLYVDRQPRLVIIDNELPGTNAPELVQAIRSLPDAPPVETPIMILSTVAKPDDFTLEVCTDWVQAPFSPEYARTRIRTWLMRGEFRWVRASIPEDEAERLAALRALNLLDTPPEDRFDRYTRIAAALFNAPVALVTLVDADRQWFKSCVGTDMTESSREVSFCAHALHRRDVMVVPDAILDKRFADNPVVTGGPRIRFYAGVPLFLPDNHCVGTLCVLDQRPRLFSEDDIRLLADLGKMVELELLNLDATAQPVARMTA